MPDAVRKFLVRSAYVAARALGLFRLSRALTRDGLRILCYHGFTMADEDRFVPGLFIAPETFERRLQYLASKNYPVLSLEDAVVRRKSGTLPDCATVITIDDGFHSVRRHAAETLQRFGFPATLYLTTFFFERQIPFLNLVVDYLCWKSRAARADLSRIDLPETQALGEVDFTGELRRALPVYAKAALSTISEPEEQCRLVTQLGEALGVDYGAIAASRILSPLTADELRELPAMGIDVQLHTHRHDLPDDPKRAAAEIDANRATIAPFATHALSHFAYPRGEWWPEHWPVLRRAGIESAVTCDSGLVYGDTPDLALNRILDSARVSQIEFEAEMSGFTELVRRARRWFGSRRAEPGLQPVGGTPGAPEPVDSRSGAASRGR